MLTSRSRRQGTIKGRTVLGKTMVAERKGFVALASLAALCRRRRRSHGIGNAVANLRPGKPVVARGIRFRHDLHLDSVASRGRSPHATQRWTSSLGDLVLENRPTHASGASRMPLRSCPRLAFAYRIRSSRLRSTSSSNWRIAPFMPLTRARFATSAKTHCDLPAFACR